MSIVLMGLLLSGCATYQFAEKVKFLSFSDDLSKGKSVGNIEGEDCTWQILGYELGGAPRVERAVKNAQLQRDGGSLSGSMGMSKKHGLCDQNKST